jgi:hypothetical protein
MVSSASSAHIRIAVIPIAVARLRVISSPCSGWQGRSTALHCQALALRPMQCGHAVSTLAAKGAMPHLWWREDKPERNVQMRYVSKINSYDFMREMHALRSLEMSQMFSVLARNLFRRKPVLRPLMG